MNGSGQYLILGNEAMATKENTYLNLLEPLSLQGGLEEIEVLSFN